MVYTEESLVRDVAGMKSRVREFDERTCKDVWEAFGRWIVDSFARGKSPGVPYLFRLLWRLESGMDSFPKTYRPIFVMSDNFMKAHNLLLPKGVTKHVEDALCAKVEEVNFAKIAFRHSQYLTKDDVYGVTRRCITRLGQVMAQDGKVKVDIGIGFLIGGSHRAAVEFKPEYAKRIVQKDGRAVLVNADDDVTPVENQTVQRDSLDAHVQDVESKTPVKSSKANNNNEQELGFSRQIQPQSRSKNFEQDENKLPSSGTEIALKNLIEAENVDLDTINNILLEGDEELAKHVAQHEKQRKSLMSEENVRKHEAKQETKVSEAEKEALEFFNQGNTSMLGSPSVEPGRARAAKQKQLSDIAVGSAYQRLESFIHQQEEHDLHIDRTGIARLNAAEAAHLEKRAKAQKANEQLLKDLQSQIEYNARKKAEVKADLKADGFCYNGAQRTFPTEKDVDKDAKRQKREQTKKELREALQKQVEERRRQEKVQKQQDDSFQREAVARAEKQLESEYMVKKAIREQASVDLMRSWERQMNLKAKHSKRMAPRVSSALGVEESDMVSARAQSMLNKIDTARSRRSKSTEPGDMMKARSSMNASSLLNPQSSTLIIEEE